jgi:uncharacterized membrane protein
MHATNLGTTDRTCNLLAGAGLLAYGLTRASYMGMISAAAGAVMLQRGATGYCGLYKALGINTKTQATPPAMAATCGCGCSAEHANATRADTPAFVAPELVAQ